jgi:uncharacterized membrane protein YfcA
VSHELGALLLLLGFAASFFSGLIGIGGALVTIPMLLYVPAALRLGSFDAREAAAIAVCQVAVAGGSATIANLSRGVVYRRLALYIVGAMTVASFATGWASQFLPARFLLALLAALALAGALAMVLPITGQEAGPPQPPFNRLLAIAIGALVGSLIGVIGGSSFLLVPLQVYLLGIPTRTAMATGLAAVLPAALAGAVGKAISGQLPLLPTLLVCVPAMAGARVGSRVNALVTAATLRRVYAVVVISVSIGLWADLLLHH